MSVYYTDTVDITPVTYNAETNATTEGAVDVGVMGYWESNSKIQRPGKSGSPEGNPEIYIDMVFFPIGTTIKKGDYVQLKKKGHITVTEERRMVKRVNLEVSLNTGQYEVEI